MKTFSIFALLALLCSFSLAAQQPKEAKPVIYDERANGFQQIEKALATADKQHKNVLLQFGANWCHWCHKLHKLMAEDEAIAGEVKKSYVVVLIDVNQKHNEDVDKKYGNPIQLGLPVIVVLDSKGKVLTTQDTGKLEVGDHHDPAKVLEFLKKWVPRK